MKKYPQHWILTSICFRTNCRSLSAIWNILRLQLVSHQHWSHQWEILCLKPWVFPMMVLYGLSYHIFIL